MRILHVPWPFGVRESPPIVATPSVVVGPIDSKISGSFTMWIFAQLFNTN